MKKTAKGRLEIDGVIVECEEALIKVSQGCCLDELVSSLLSNLCLWHRKKPSNLCTFLQVICSSCKPLSSPSLSLTLFLSSLSYYCSLILAGPFFISIIAQVRHHAASSGLEKSSRIWGLSVWGSKVCLHWDGVDAWANTDSVSLFKPPEEPTTPTNT